MIPNDYLDLEPVHILPSERGNSVKSLLISNDPAYIKHFTSIFEELWKNSLILYIVF